MRVCALPLVTHLRFSVRQVRAGTLQELIYKQGQAGVTKATVSIVFNNEDKDQSPIGYSEHDTITVTRQVSMQCAVCSVQCTVCLWHTF